MRILFRGFNFINVLDVLFFKTNGRFILIRRKTGGMKYLNVAEKNDAAKNIAQHLSRGTSRRREGLSPYNKIYEFEAEVSGAACRMVMTSVSGHLLALEFAGAHRHWHACSPLSLFDAPVFKYCPDNYQKIKQTLEREVRSCDGLIIWTDCDREGENIGFEIIEVCCAVKSDLQIYRAKFSEITAVSVRRALHNLQRPNKHISDAVDVRQELDLRIGAAFTRFQTLRLQKVFPSKLADNLVSYGSCQFPTLGFVVERYRAVENFVAEPFWKIKVIHTVGALSVEFCWERGRVFAREPCAALLDQCRDARHATVERVHPARRTRARPLPLDTVELEKLASRKLKINAKETMRVAEKLYTQGLISYPRTETNRYPDEMDLRALVALQAGDARWGTFAQRVLEAGPRPRRGNKSDHAHPPIHPTKHAHNLSGNEQRLYEFIVRSFLACCSADAEGEETAVTALLGGEVFSATGLRITATNYLDVYIYDKWTSKEIHHYQVGDTFIPTHIDMAEGTTSPPALLTEADLIALMEKHGIGTDATHAEHIETIKRRSYVCVSEGARFVPGELGMGLVEGYDALGLAVARPHLRAALEAALRDICAGTRDPAQVLAEQVAAYRAVFEEATARAPTLDAALARRFGEQPCAPPPPPAPSPRPQAAIKCPKCGSDMIVKRKKSNSEEVYLSCASFPACRSAVWFPSVVRSVEVLPDACPHCGPTYKRIRLEWRNNSLNHIYPSPHIACLGGCDPTFLELLQINLSSCVRGASQPAPAAATAAPQPQPPPARAVLPPARDVPPPASTGGGVHCACDRPAVLLTVRKQNANFGKKFYKCQVGKESGGCDFFLWAPEEGAGERSSGGGGEGSRGGGGDRGRGAGGEGSTSPPDCTCGLPCSKITVQKEGPNKGRPFYGCSKEMNARCNFFQWADEAPRSASTLTNGGGARGRGRGAGAGSGRGAGPGRRCGLCRQHGHTRSRCPQMQQ